MVYTLLTVAIRNTKKETTRGGRKRLSTLPTALLTSMTGSQAFINGEGHLYLKGDEEFQTAYYAQWRSDHNFDNDSSGHHEADSWDQHYSEEIAPYDVTDSDLSGVFIATMVPVGIILGLLTSFGLVIWVTAIGGSR